MRFRTSLPSLFLLVALGLFGRVPLQRVLLAFQAQPAEVPSHLIWFDRAGKRLSVVDSPANERGLELSPDGKRATVTMLTAERRSRDVWMVDIASGSRTRFTDDAGDKLFSIWSPDSQRIVFDREQGVDGGLVVRDLFQKPANGGADMLLYADKRPKWPLSFSSDGRFLAFVTFNVRSGSPLQRSCCQDIEVLPLSGSDRRPIPFQQFQGTSSYPRFSPDGRWIAFGSDGEVYVAPFPGPGRKWQVSVAEGSWPRWSRDGKELFYVATGLTNTLMAVPVSAQGSVFTAGRAQRLFDIEPVVGGFYSYDVSADGQRFLVNTAIAPQTTSPKATIALNGPPRMESCAGGQRIVIFTGARDFEGTHACASTSPLISRAERPAEAGRDDFSVTKRR